MKNTKLWIAHTKLGDVLTLNDSSTHLLSYSTKFHPLFSVELFKSVLALPPWKPGHHQHRFGSTRVSCDVLLLRAVLKCGRGCEQSCDDAGMTSSRDRQHGTGPERVRCRDANEAPEQSHESPFSPTYRVSLLACVPGFFNCTQTAPTGGWRCYRQCFLPLPWKQWILKLFCNNAMWMGPKCSPSFCSS